MMKATKKVAQGDFSVMVNGSFVFELDALAGSFNKIVQESERLVDLSTNILNLS